MSPAGLIFGTAAVPHSGTTCAGSPHPLTTLRWSRASCSSAQDGHILKLADIDQLTAADTNGIDNDTLKNILENSGSSCWSATGPGDPPQTYPGLPGSWSLDLDLAQAGPARLGIQIQNNWFNVTPRTRPPMPSSRLTTPTGARSAPR